MHRAYQPRTALMPHQAPAVAKMLPTRVGALFMDMGTGKSRTAIEIVARRADRISRVVWFCPVSLMFNVEGEILKHTRAQPSDICVFGPRTDDANLPAVAWYVIGIESMSQSNRLKMAAARIMDNRAFVIVDESQYIKGHCARRTTWITRIAEPVRYRLVLTGTPMTQGVVDHFAQMRFLSPKILGYQSFYSFARNHLEYHPEYPDMIIASHNTDYLAAKMAPYVYQVTKDQCLSLPAKLYETEYTVLTDEQRRAYDAVKEEMFDELERESFSSIAIFRAFGRLQRIVSGIDQGVPISSLRLIALENALERIPAGEKAVIWCKYRYDVDQVRATVQDCITITGEVPSARRHAALAQWRDPDGPRFAVCTAAAAGHGFTLTEAAYAVFYTYGFKYSERIQSEDRCHRIGQTRPVTYIDIVCRDSIDERIADALSRKESAADEFRHEVERFKDVKGGRNAIMKLVRAL